MSFCVMDTPVFIIFIIFFVYSFLVKQVDYPNWLFLLNTSLRIRKKQRQILKEFIPRSVKNVSLFLLSITDNNTVLIFD